MSSSYHFPVKSSLVILASSFIFTVQYCACWCSVRVVAQPSIGLRISVWRPLPIFFLNIHDLAYNTYSLRPLFLSTLTHSDLTLFSSASEPPTDSSSTSPFDSSSRTVRRDPQHHGLLNHPPEQVCSQGRRTRP